MSATDAVWSKAGFTPISSTVIYSPPLSIYSAIAGADTPPTTVLLCAWLNAAPKHILKYTLLYQTLFPTASILVVTTGSREIIRSLGAIQPAFSTDLALALIHDNPGPLLAAVYSNGGSYSLSAFALAYRDKYASTLPISAMLLDSTPSPDHSSYEEDVTKARMAFVTGLPRSPLLYYPGYVAVTLALTGVWLFRYVTGTPAFIEIVRKRLNDPNLVRVGRRTYVYCKTDPLIGWEYVESHADEAERKGWKVEKVRFDDGEHVGHLRRYPKEYENAVVRTWAERERLDV